MTANKKRRQHYVWRYYLEAWAVEGSVACLRHGQSRTFRTDPKNLAAERDFYRLDEPSAAEVAFVRALTQQHNGSLRSLHEGWIQFCETFFAMKRAAQPAALEDEELARELDRTQNDLEEDFHSSIEGQNADLLGSLRAGQVDVVSSAELFVDFSYFLALQYTRTRKTKDSVLASLTGLPSSLSPDRLWMLLRQIVAINIGHALFMKRTTHKITLYEAVEESFITSDQPVNNLDAMAKRSAMRPNTWTYSTR